LYNVWARYDTNGFHIWWNIMGSMLFKNLEENKNRGREIRMKLTPTPSRIAIQKQHSLSNKARLPGDGNVAMDTVKSILAARL